MKMSEERIRRIIRESLRNILLQRSPCDPYTKLQALSDTARGLEYIKQYEKPSPDDDEECDAQLDSDLINYWKLDKKLAKATKKALQRLIVNRDKSRGGNAVVVTDPQRGNKKLNHNNFKQWARGLALTESKKTRDKNEQ